MTKRIKLQTGETTLVDDEDYEFLMRFKWRYGGQSHKKYVIASGDRYNKSQVTFYLHTLILGGRHGDHADGNTLDNRKTNVRRCTRQENNWNKGKMKAKNGKPTSSKYKGVNKPSGSKKFIALVCKDRKLYRCGSFENEDDAARAYNKKAVELFGKFAWLNKVPPLKSTNKSGGSE